MYSPSMDLCSSLHASFANHFLRQFTGVINMNNASVAPFTSLCHHYYFIPA